MKSSIQRMRRSFDLLFFLLSHFSALNCESGDLDVSSHFSVLMCDDLDVSRLNHRVDKWRVLWQYIDNQGGRRRRKGRPLHRRLLCLCLSLSLSICPVVWMFSAAPSWWSTSRALMRSARPRGARPKSPAATSATGRSKRGSNSPLFFVRLIQTYHV